MGVGTRASAVVTLVILLSFFAFAQTAGTPDTGTQIDIEKTTSTYELQPEDVPEWDREILTYTIAGDRRPQRGLDPATMDTEESTVHVITQFTFDQPGKAPPAERSLIEEYDLDYCGSYMDDTGYENAHCFGIPTSKVEQFSQEPAVVSIIPRTWRWKTYPQTQEIVEDHGARLWVETYDRMDDGNFNAPVTLERVDDKIYATEEINEWATVKQLLQREDVAWVQPVPPRQSGIDVSREHVGVNEVNGDGVSEQTGNGVLIGVLDSGIDVQNGNLHPHFQNSDVDYAYDYEDHTMPPEDNNNHGTHVAGTIAGNGSFGATVYTGMAPEADLLIGKILDVDQGAYGEWNAGARTTKNLFKNLDQETSRTMAAISNSWHSGMGPRGSFTTRYGHSARSADRWAHSNPETLPVFSNGNACDDSPTSINTPVNCTTDTVTVPASGKNVLSVGATYARGFVSPLNDLKPPEDVADLNNGRVKPEVLAPGENIDAPIPGNSSNRNRYGAMDGTSMAAPHVSGIIALIEEEYSIDANSVRALLSATTKPVRNPFDHLEGYGEVDAHDALNTNDYESVQKIFHGSVMQKCNQHGQDTYTFDVPSDAYQIDAVLSWIDPPKVAGGVKGIIFNKLNLVLESPSGKTWKKYNAANLKKITVPQSDTEAGTWKLTVKGGNIGHAFNPFCNKNTQSYDGVVRVVKDQPGIRITANDVNPAPKNVSDLGPSDLRIDKGTTRSFGLSIRGLGYKVKNVMVELNASGTDLDTCSTNPMRAGDFENDIAKGDVENISFCIRSPNGTTWGTQNLTLKVASINGVHTNDGNARISAGTLYDDRQMDVSAKRYTFPVFVKENTPPTAVSNVNSTTHAENEWSNDEFFTFTWNPATDSKSGVMGYSYAFTTQRSHSPPNRKTANFTPVTTADTNVTNDDSYYFHVRALDRSGNAGPTETAGPYRIDTEDPYYQPGDTANASIRIAETNITGTPNYYPRTGGGFDYRIKPTTFSVVWEEATDDNSGVARYEIEMTETSATTPYLNREVNASGAVLSGSTRAVDVGPVKQGGNTLQVKAYDEAGNVVESYPHSVCTAFDDPTVKCRTRGELMRQVENIEDAWKERYIRDQMGPPLTGPMCEYFKQDGISEKRKQLKQEKAKIQQQIKSVTQQLHAKQQQMQRQAQAMEQGQGVGGRSNTQSLQSQIKSLQNKLRSLKSKLRSIKQKMRNLGDGGDGCTFTAYSAPRLGGGGTGGSLARFFMGDETANVYVDDGGRTEDYSFQTRNGTLRKVGQNNVSDPTLRVEMSQATFERITNSDTPKTELRKAYRDGDVEIEGVGFMRSMKVGIAEFGVQAYQFATGLFG